MTPEEINKEIAEKVMGTPECDNWAVWHVSRGEWARVDDSCGHERCYPKQCPALYSTNIQAAWQVVEKMRGGGWKFSMKSHNNHIALQFYKSGIDLRAKCDDLAICETAERAICLAALKVVV